MNAISQIQTAQLLKNDIKSKGVEPKRVPCNESGLQSFKNILKYEYRKV